QTAEPQRAEREQRMRAQHPRLQRMRRRAELAGALETVAKHEPDRAARPEPAEHEIRDPAPATRQQRRTAVLAARHHHAARPSRRASPVASSTNASASHASRSGAAAAGSLMTIFVSASATTQRSATTETKRSSIGRREMPSTCGAMTRSRTAARSKALPLLA